MMKSHVDYILSRQKKGFLPSLVEFIIVDDGSKDSTWKIISDWTKRYNTPSAGVFVYGLK